MNANTANRTVIVCVLFSYVEGVKTPVIVLENATLAGAEALARRYWMREIGEASGKSPALAAHILRKSHVKCSEVVPVDVGAIR